MMPTTTASASAKSGIHIASGPKANSDYGGDYCAVFFEGPDELKLEMV